MDGDKTRIAILGGGFGGVYTAKYLDQAMTRAERSQIEIALVNRENYIVFQPFLPEVISGTIETLHAISPIRRLAKRSHLHTRDVEAIDLENKTVRLSPGFRPKSLTLKYDQLVLGMGTRLNYSVVPGMQEHAIPFKYLGDALRLRDQTVRVLEEADIETDPEEKKKLLTFIVGGGGFSGVEVVAELNDFLKSAIRAYTDIRQDDLRVVLLQSADRILPELGEDLAEFAHRILYRRGVEIRLNTRLIGVTADGAVIQEKNSGERQTIPSRTVVATVPAAPHPLIADLPCQLERGRVVVDRFLDVPDWPGVWALGDCAAVPQPDGITSPPTAQHALRQAKTCAHNILATIRSRPLKPFSFTGLGKLASLGQRSAVAEVLGVKVSGIFAWLLWRTIYLSKFPGLDRKIRVAMDWTLDLFLPRDITQIRIFHQGEVVTEHFEEGELVFDRGDFGNKIYFIIDGEIQIDVDGQTIANLCDGDVFGEIALISNRARTATARAQSATNVVTVSREAFKKLVAHLPGVKTSMETLMQQRLKRIVDLSQETENVGAENAE